MTNFIIIISIIGPIMIIKLNDNDSLLINFENMVFFRFGVIRFPLFECCLGLLRRFSFSLRLLIKTRWKSCFLFLLYSSTIFVARLFRFKSSSF